ncbi:C39 family peptidase [Kutzneria buriramensis]|uniref:Peptidase C39-like protein n=1 Tax=Kutzneria buriramensis TaxID=1045776 RepID=A0A3E0GV35_9PSEU|nr:C39 family peptidase [Kutzneria buriramensis]REH29487.1 peptidase C39-like protein [Kutzneria buriramensis]
MSPVHNRLTRLALVGTVAGALIAQLTTAPATAATSVAPVDFHQWSSDAQFHSGHSDGMIVRDGLVIGRPAGTVQHTEPALGTTRTYDYSTWTSPPYSQRFGATQLIASWNAATPAGTWLQVEMRGTSSKGTQTGWYVMGRWASGDEDIQRTSVPDQTDATGTIDVDTFEAADGVQLMSYQLRVTLYRLHGVSVSPHLRMVGAMTSAVPDRFTVPTSPSGGAWGIELPVPRYSQDIHKGQYPQYDGGGEAWCSPTSTQMVVEYWGKHPTAQQLSWVDPSYADPSVDFAARGTYDYDYQGAGNWPFNTAYAASYGLDAHITRLHSLQELEGYIKRGIPVITSQSFQASELDGAGYSTSGHIMVVVGFTATGDVIVNDPASSDDPAVRNVYKRGQFENVWLRTERPLPGGGVGSGPGGVVYIVTPHGMPLP